MAAIYKREMHSYLTSAVGYVFLAVFFVFSGVLKTSSIVFHSPQPGQQPYHLALSCPQAEQTYKVLAF